MAYATPAELLARYDARVIGDLVGDVNERVDAADLPTDENLLAALDDASGEIEAAVLQGKRYTTADLAALAGNTRFFLVRICCQIAIARLWERRLTLDASEQIAAEQAFEQARKALDRLKRGEEIFDIQAVKDAGVPSLVKPTATTIRTRNLLVDELRGTYYPTRRSSQHE